VATAVQVEAVDDVSQSRLVAHQRGSPIVSKAVNHFWYGDTSPWTERRLEHSFDEQSRPTAKVVILDRQHPPQPRSDRTAEGED
jgi:hypothetical protein